MRRIQWLLVLLAVLQLSGCGIRVRTPEAPLPAEDPASEQETVTEEQPQIIPEEPEIDPNRPSEEDPESDRREFSEDADAELSSDAETVIIIEETETPAPQGAAQEGSGGHTATETVPDQQAEEQGVADDAEVAETALQYYQTLLDSRLGELFECKRLYVYWETPEDYQTVSKTSAEHQVILLAGAYDVSAKLLPDALTVDDGWVLRKNPGAIVKCVESGLLGRDVLAVSAAQTVRENLLAREGWNAMDAVKSGTVLLLSQELLRSPAGQTAAAVYLAKSMYPAQMSDIDPDEALRLLMQESTGTEPGGIYAG